MVDANHVHLGGGSYLSLGDVNLLDADTAHGYQDVGAWGNGGGVSAVAVASNTGAFGGKGIEATCSGTSTATINTAAGPEPTLTALAAYAASVQVETAEPGYEAQFIMQWRAGGAYNGEVSQSWTALTAGVPAVFVASGTAPASTDASRLLVQFRKVGGGNPDASVTFVATEGVVRAGSDASFVPSLRVVGDLDVRAKIAADDYTNGNQHFVARWLNATNYDYRCYVNASAGVTLSWSPDGTAASALYANSTVPLPFSDGATGYVRVTLDVSGRTIQFLTSDDGSTYTQLGTDITGAATSIGSTGAALEIGSRSSGAAELLTGKVYWVEVRDGIDGPIVAAWYADQLTEAGVTAAEAEVTW